MKLPRTIQQWEQVTPQEHEEIELAQGVAICILALAGIKSPLERDSTGAEIGDVVLTGLMDSMLRAPQLMRLFNSFLDDSRIPEPDCVAPEANRS